uniref:Phospholipid-transporting ATPase n=1 Tax=Dermatophagoides pteronyssinus TaxID=6956 RepID=A0A6P6YF58_DERPT|nr:probable phospholipid-transporting ATPase IM [Dermatophagoides pteronyssinus]
MAIRRNRRQTENERIIRANDPVFNSKFQYAKNYIKTSKYTLLTFLPLNLFVQFQRLANFYFLCLLILQLIPFISSLTPITTAVPLIFVLLITAIKDAIDDIQKHRSDNQVNNRLSKVLRNGKLIDERWFKVQVGDIILIESDNFVAADLLLLSTSEPNGLCYVETAELDGETNLKCRQALPETAELGDNIEQLAEFYGEINCEAPNNNLTKFEGVLKWHDEKFSLDNDKMLLRGCRLRNTKWCFGVVIFAGRDTKLMQNSGKTIFKRTSLDRLLNLLILGIVLFLIIMCLFCTIACGVWETLTGQYFRIYLPWDHVVPDNPTSGATIISILIFFSYAIVLNTVVPISLYVSVEIIRFFHSLWINWDIKMYYEPMDTPAKARTTTLNEELGQIQYIFSDKTGTLTQNIMTFNKCTIMGEHYGDILNDRGEPIDINEHTPPVDFSSNPLYEKKFRFYDPNLLNQVQEGNEDVHEFFRLLAVCHTVMCEEKDSNLEYQAQSPDEAALTSAARNFGFVFRSRTPTSITIIELGEIKTYELLDILDFNNVRKRMSVIVRQNGLIKLYCKGADSVIFERMDPSCEMIKETTVEHLNKFASEGLRTLCLANKIIDENFYRSWKYRLNEASCSLENREDKVDACYEEIEKNLILLGATAIEDKLQDGVPQTIANLASAGIKLWVLTGDKQETAINIGYSCQLLSDDMADVFVVEGFEFDQVKGELMACRDIMKTVAKQHKNSNMNCDVSVITFEDDTTNIHPSTCNTTINNNNGKINAITTNTVTRLNPNPDSMNDSNDFALVINGHSLIHALDPALERLFLEVASTCKAVICCRVTPLQKAMVVDLVKRYKKAVTLAIGDGANDVSMIKTAHIGVGISGQEGMQAVLSSDFSIAQFRYLERLLLVHGRWSYLRMCKFLQYFFYKNFSFTLCNLWYAFFCGFSAQTLFDPVFISFYNVFYTSLPVLAMGIFDQDVDDIFSIHFPLLYTPGIIDLLFNKLIFLKSVAHGIITSFVLFFVSYGAFKNAVGPEGINLDGHQIFGTVVSTILVIVVTAQIALDTSYWTVFNHIVIWGSLAFYFSLTLLINSNFIGNQYLGCFRMTLSSGQFWFTMFIILIILLFPVIAVRFYNITVHPTLSDRCRIKQRYLRKKALVHSYDPYIRRKSSALRSRRSIRSGYAFAHQEGFGHLITSGKIMRGKTQSYNLNVPNDSKMISTTTSNNINSKTNSTNNHNRHHHHHHHHHHHRHDQQQQQQHHQSTINQSNRAKVTPISNNKQPSNMI